MTARFFRDLRDQREHRRLLNWDTQEAVEPSTTTDPLLGIYGASGLRDSGGTSATGVATSFHCTNKRAVSEKLVIQLRNCNGAAITTQEFTLGSYRTFTMSTHATAAFSEDSILSAGRIINQRFAKIWSTTPNVFCSAMVIDAAAAAPIGVSLHLARSNAPAGIEE